LHHHDLERRWPNITGGHPVPELKPPASWKPAPKPSWKVLPGLQFSTALETMLALPGKDYLAFAPGRSSSSAILGARVMPSFQFLSENPFIGRGPRGLSSVGIGSFGWGLGVLLLGNQFSISVPIGWEYLGGNPAAGRLYFGLAPTLEYVWDEFALSTLLSLLIPEVGAAVTGVGGPGRVSELYVDLGRLQFRWFFTRFLGLRAGIGCRISIPSQGPVAAAFLSHLGLVFRWGPTGPP
jgi:hypothetical protein